MFKAFIFFSFIFTSSAALAVDEVLLQKVANSSEWHRLMHYKKKSKGYESEVDGQGFFFAANGAVDPLAEIRASVQAILDNPIVGKLEQPVRCAFPERTRFLKEKLALQVPSAKAGECKYYEYYWNLYNDPKSATIVFSSAYPNNSASMFGHTFLKINSARGSELLDSGVNFAAAVADDENPFAFVWFGLTGGYIGQWSFQPYYVKVHEYVNFESRDLWEYELNLSKEETKRLLDHIWELEANSYFKYYFFDENCSYQVLAAIEAIRPDWNISEHKIYMIPGESIKNLFEQEGVVKQVHYRPSHYNKMWAKYSALSAQEKAVFHQMVKTQEIADASSSRMVMDAMISYLAYLKAEEEKTFETKYGAFQKAAQQRRAQLGMLTEQEIEKQKVPMATNRPDWGHDPFAFEFGGGHRDYQGVQETFGRIKIKSAYHDLLNKDLGYSKYNHIDFPSLEIQSSDLTGEIRIEEVVGISTTSIMPINDLRRPISYRGEVLMRTPREYFDCDGCYEGRAEGGLGYTVAPYNDMFRLYSFLNFQFSTGSHLERGFDLAPGIELGFISTLSEDYKVSAQYKTFCSFVNSESCASLQYLSLSQSFSFQRNFEVRNVNKWVLSDKRLGPQHYELGVSFVYLFR